MGGGVYSYILTWQHIVHTVNLQWPNEFHVLLFLRFLIFHLIYTKGEGRGWKLGIFWGVLKFLSRKMGGGNSLIKIARSFTLCSNQLYRHNYHYLTFILLLWITSRIVSILIIIIITIIIKINHFSLWKLVKLWLSQWSLYHHHHHIAHILLSSSRVGVCVCVGGGGVIYLGQEGGCEKYPLTPQQ